MIAGKLLLKGVVPESKARVTMLGTNKTFRWEKTKEGMKITVPPLTFMPRPVLAVFPARVSVPALCMLRYMEPAMPVP